MGAQNSEEPLCYVELLGPLRVTIAGRLVEQFATQKAAALLAWLALHPGPQPRERVIELLWPERDLPAGRNNLSTALSSLRRQLEPPGVRRGTILIASHSEIGLNSAVLATDALLFARLLKASEKTDAPEVRADLLMRAAALYRDEILPGSYQDWAVRESERIQSRLHRALAQLAQDQESLGNIPAALETTQRNLTLDPYSEDIHCQQVRLYVRMGQIRAANEAHQRFDRLFQEEFGTAPSARTRTLVADLLSAESSLRAGPVSGAVPAPHSRELSTHDTFQHGEAHRPSSNLPLVLGRFIGRESELAQLAHLLLTFKEQPDGPEIPDVPCRLVTLIGPGGIGKTRLAVEFARNASGRFSSWCGFVSLAEVTNADQVETALATAILPASFSGATPIESVIAFINKQDRVNAPPLLIVDNLEHLLIKGEDGQPEGESTLLSLTSTLLKRIPGLRVLCTSRRRLGLRGERLLPVKPLPVPDMPTSDAKTDELSALLMTPSVRLYVDRAQAVRPDFGLTHGNAFAVAALCRQLEGSPLALELAAAWVRILPPRKMWERLTQGLDIPAGSYADLPDRHRTLTAALDWSFRLLTPFQQRLFARLSVFRGGWTLESAEAIMRYESSQETHERYATHSSIDLLTPLAGLQEASLISTVEQADGQTRYLFLETVRTFSSRQLIAMQETETEELHRIHAAHFLNLAEEAATYQRSADEGEWLTRLETEHENLRAALDRNLVPAGDVEVGVRLVVALIRFWYVRGYWRQGWDYAQRAIELGHCNISPDLYARLLNGAAGLIRLIGDMAKAQALYEECLDVLRPLNEMALVANVLHGLGFLALRQGDLERAQPLYEESLAVLRELQDSLGIADELHHLGLVAHERGDLERAQGLYEESLAIRQPFGDLRGVGNTIQCLANIACAQKDYARARELYERDLDIRDALGDRLGMATVYCNLGNLSRSSGDQDQASAFVRRSLKIQHELGDWHGIAESLDILAGISLENNNLIEAANLYGTAESLRTEVAVSRTPADEHEHGKRILTLREQLSPVEFSTAWSNGSTQSWKQKIMEILSDQAITPA